MFVKDFKTVILMNKDAEEEKENKNQGLSKNFLLRELVHPNLGN
jgi:hypothetical protein